MNRRSILLPVALLAAVVAASPASAAGNGWSCISPFANFTNGTYPGAEPAPDAILNSLAIAVARTDSTPLTAVPGQPLALRDLHLSLNFTDTRPAEQMYRRTGGATATYNSTASNPLIPYTQVENTPRSLSIRANPSDGDADWWAYNTGSTSAPNWVYANKIAAPGEPPKVRDAADAPNGTWHYASPSLDLGHRYLWHTGNSQFPLDAWVTIAASNTVEGVQTLPVKGYWTVNIQDATPGTPGNPANYNNDAVTATVPPVELDLPRTSWTPTGAGPVEFTIASPGRLGIIQVESKGYERTGYNKPMNIRPFGSVYVRAQTEAYGASNDCIPGAISLANPAIASSQAGMLFADADPVNPDPALGDPATPGYFTNQTGQQKAVGVRGRFAFAFTPVPAIAVAALPPATPAAPKKPTFAKATKAKASKKGAVKLKLTNPNATTLRYKLAAKTVSKYKIGKSRKLVTVASTKTISLKPGASSASIKLSKTAAKLLKQRKSLKVKITLTPVGGGSAATKTITIQRA